MPVCTAQICIYCQILFRFSKNLFSYNSKLSLYNYTSFIYKRQSSGEACKKGTKQRRSFLYKRQHFDKIWSQIGCKNNQTSSIFTFQRFLNIFCFTKLIFSCIDWWVRQNLNLGLESKAPELSKNAGKEKLTPVVKQFAKNSTCKEPFFPGFTCQLFFLLAALLHLLMQEDDLRMLPDNFFYFLKVRASYFIARRRRLILTIVVSYWSFAKTEVTRDEYKFQFIFTVQQLFCRTRQPIRLRTQTWGHVIKQSIAARTAIWFRRKFEQFKNCTFRLLCFS